MYTTKQRNTLLTFHFVQFNFPTPVQIVQIKRKDGQRRFPHRAIIPQGHDKFTKINFTRTVFVKNGKDSFVEFGPCQAQIMNEFH